MAAPAPAQGPCSPPESKKRSVDEELNAELEAKRSAVDSFGPLRVKKLSENATIPTRATQLAAGYDLSSAEDSKVPAGGRQLVKTDIAIAVPVGTYGRVAPRSGLALKKGIDVGAGVIDADYSKGDRIAQLILERIITPEVLEVSDLNDTDRGAGGFGSTGSSSLQ